MRDFFEQLYIRRIVQYALYLFLALVMQNMLFTQLRPLGICPMWLPAVAASVGMFAGPAGGVAFGLILGIFADMAFTETTVLFTILFPVIAFGTAFVSQFFINRRFFAFLLLALGAELITAMIQMLATLVGDAWSTELIKTALIQTAWSMPFAALAYIPPAKWIK